MIPGAVVGAALLLIVWLALWRWVGGPLTWVGMAALTGAALALMYDNSMRGSWWAVPWMVVAVLASHVTERRYGEWQDALRGQSKHGAETIDDLNAATERDN